MSNPETVGARSPLDALKDALVAFLNELCTDERSAEIGKLPELRDSVRDGQNPTGLQLEGWSNHLVAAEQPNHIGKAASAAALVSSHLEVAFENDGICPTLADMGGHKALESLAEAKAWLAIHKGEKVSDDFQVVRDSFVKELAREIGVEL